MHTDLVIDADGHCNEPWEDLTPWMPTAYHQRAPVGFADRHGTSRMYVEGRLSTTTEGLGVAVPAAPGGIGERIAPAHRLRHHLRRPPLRPHLRTCRGCWPAARRAPADRPRRPVRRLGHHGRRLRAYGEIQLCAHDGL